MTTKAPRYQLKHPVRIVTAASLFDGHDAAINVMRRIMQASGAEVIHLGHNRSVKEIVDCAVQEDAQAIAITSYQGGHIEYLKYMYDLLQEAGAKTKIFGGGGGTILLPGAAAPIYNNTSKGKSVLHWRPPGACIKAQSLERDV